jgi:MarR family transcriptional regulator, lower aerobic nicotinate degradation pathway regulator
MDSPPDPYLLDRQIGFLLRRATQRHLAIFAAAIPGLTPTQFAALAHLAATGPTSQNALGRATAMDAATIKGVIDRLRRKGYVASEASEGDRRRVLVSVTAEGRAAFAALLPAARSVTAETLAPLNEGERDAIVAILARIG